MKKQISAVKWNLVDSHRKDSCSEAENGLLSQPASPSHCHLCPDPSSNRLVNTFAIINGPTAKHYMILMQKLPLRATLVTSAHDDPICLMVTEANTRAMRLPASGKLPMCDLWPCLRATVASSLLPV